MQKRSLHLLLQKFLPYWPLFLLLVGVCYFAAWRYARMITPMYEAVATIMIKDDKQANLINGYGSSAIFQGSNAVENEMEVIRSKDLMKEVVVNLNLYAPIFEEGNVRPLSAYTSSPVSIIVKDPLQIKKFHQSSFSYNGSIKQVIVENRRIPLDQWTRFPFGELMFVENKGLQQFTTNTTFFQLHPVQSVANSLRSGLSLMPINKGSSVIMLKYRDDVPGRAEDILNELSVVYGRASVRAKGATTANTLAFLEDRIRFVENELDSLENKIRSYKSQKGIVDLGSQGQIFMNNVSANDQKIAGLNNQLSILNQVERYVVSKDKKAGVVPSTLGVNDPMLNSLLEKLFESESNYERLSKTVPENNPLMVSLQTEIKRIRPSLLENIRSQKAGIQVSMGGMASYNKSYNSMLRTIPQKEKDLLDYTRQQAIKNSVYTFLLQKREETAMINSSTVADSRVVDAAEASMVANGPSKPVIYLMGIMFGLLLGVAIVICRELLNTKFLYRAEVETATTAPVIAELAYVKGKSPVFVDRQHNMLLYEQFRQLRVALGLFGKVRNRKRVLVTSSISGEGKSFVSSNLALSLAQAGKKVVLIDLDLRNPNNTRQFNLQGERGMTDFLSGDFEPFEVVRKTNFENLFFIPAGLGDVFNAVELLLNGKLENLLAYLQENFDSIIIDTAPVEFVSDAYVLSDFCDVSLFIVRHGYTPYEMLQLSQKHQKLERLKNAAVLFNGVKSRGFFKVQYGYGYGYGYDRINSKYDPKGIYKMT